WAGTKIVSRAFATYFRRVGGDFVELQARADVLDADSICLCCGEADGGTSSVSSAVWDSTEAVPPSFAPEHNFCSHVSLRRVTVRPRLGGTADSSGETRRRRESCSI